MTEKYIDSYLKHLKVVYIEWEKKNAGWLIETEKIIDNIIREIEEVDRPQLYQDVA